MPLSFSPFLSSQPLFCHLYDMEVLKSKRFNFGVSLHHNDTILAYSFPQFSNTEKILLPMLTRVACIYPLHIASAIQLVAVVP